MLGIWIFNVLFLIYQVIKCTPNFIKDETDSETIVHNFMMNTPIEQLEKIKYINSINPLFAHGGILLLIISLLI